MSPFVVVSGRSSLRKYPLPPHHPTALAIVICHTLKALDYCSRSSISFAFFHAGVVDTVSPAVISGTGVARTTSLTCAGHLLVCRLSRAPFAIVVSVSKLAFPLRRSGLKCRAYLPIILLPGTRLVSPATYSLQFVLYINCSCYSTTAVRLRCQKVPLGCQ